MNNQLHLSEKMTPKRDPWEAYLDIEEHGKLTLSNIEFTTTYLCNMRCEHCAVGFMLQQKDPDALPIELLLKRLEEIPHLRAISITGGEPMFSKKSIDQYVLPLLAYAHKRGVRTQMNSNLTMPLDRYLLIAPYLDVLHISHNWGTVDDFIDGGFANMERKPPRERRADQFKRMIENSQALAEAGVLVSAETMLNHRTLPHLEHIHKQVVEEMKCARHEIHPMYPSDFAANLDILSLAETRAAIHHLLDIRDENVWMLFGTLPFYPCNQNQEDLALLERLYQSKNVSVRNDPDGRSRLNVNIFNGDVIVADFGDEPSLGNIENESLTTMFDRWIDKPLAKSLNCHCPAVRCLGPNLLVKNAYYPEQDFQQRRSLL
ncbi:radical SAM/CxCxxxxC motif protein YfkAB [Bacillus sp. FJAT-50079]|uniref:radical SAM/CxCxxxxC motif protein YfkAB n=1 Tax=Bacillus sp. FJAT-50079 TaxID=2833577 RepID=UPI001BC98373|nr:radical SAM/CxCxxxxC motif protein YfkAB [Bacillus sp. FJAT-50079]MBS4208337.1 radical SAM/CxCxxxxC motif protein YfkAB [Bacillus sp. FJAT-50079]